MNRLSIETRGIGSWRERLANPDKHWVRGRSAYEAAVSWELASRTESGLPEPVRTLLEAVYGKPELLLAVAEHKVPLLGGNADSQNDVWALVKTPVGTVSVTVEAKANEPFGDGSLGKWLEDGKSERAVRNRAARWEYLRGCLPDPVEAGYGAVAYQLLHRCASSVIEARRMGFSHAACIVQAFNTPDNQFSEFTRFCEAVDLVVPRGSIGETSVGGIELAIGWVDCPLSSDQQIASVA